MREKTQHIDYQPLTPNLLVINQLCNVDKLWITLTKMLGYLLGFWVLIYIG